MSNPNESSNVFIGIVVIAVFVGLIYRMFGGEVEGTVNNVDNCQVEITVKDEFYNRIFRKFICEYSKTDAGKIIYGTCYHANFDSDGNCTKLITYDKDSNITCPNGQYVDSFGDCQCDKSSQYATKNGCYDKCGPNSTYNSSTEKCDCDEGYIIENNKCINPNDKCGLNSTYNVDDETCHCDAGYIVENNKCVDPQEKCGPNSWYNLVRGECVCNGGYTLKDNQCVADIGTIEVPATAE